jgi:hypothetical protein
MNILDGWAGGESRGGDSEEENTPSNRVSPLLTASYRMHPIRPLTFRWNPSGFVARGHCARPRNE